MKWNRLIAILALGFLMCQGIASAQNVCVESGPYIYGWTCLSQGGSVINSGSLNTTIINVCSGQIITPPYLITVPTFSDGSKRRTIHHDCPPPYDYYESKPVHYVPDALTFDPPIPTSLTTSGTYTYTAKVGGRRTSLLSWWPGNGNANDILGAHNGTLVGNATYGSGKVGNGFVLDGNGDRVSLANHTDFQLQNFTIEAWIKRSNSTKSTQEAGQTTAAIFSYGNGGYGFGIRDNGTLFLDKVGVSEVTVSAALTDSAAWHHVAVTKNGTSVKFYLDGTAYTASPYNPDFVFSTALAIGARGDGSGNSFWGAIDEVGVYSCTLSTADIQAIYNAGAAGKCWSGSPAGCSAVPLDCSCSASPSATVGTVTIKVWGNGDTDGDGISDCQEVSVGRDPNLPEFPGCIGTVNGVVGWWRAQGNAIDLVSGTSADLVNGATYITAGRVGQAFSFDGTDDHVRVSDSTALHITGPITIEAWVDPTTTGTDQAIVSKWDMVSGPNQKSYLLGLDSYGRAYFRVSPTGTDTGTASVISPSTLPMDKWTHVAGTYDGTGLLKLYVNGALQSQATYTLGIFSGANDLAIGGIVGGGYWGDVASPFAGSIDEPSVYNVALTAAQIQAIYVAQGSGKCPSRDGDALPDDWEWFYFSDLTRTGTGDYDGDGLTDLQEYLAGTDPTLKTPVITSQPASQTVTVGNDAVFPMVATGDSLSYTWYFHGRMDRYGLDYEVVGNDSTLDLADVQRDDAGIYSVRVAESAGDSVNSVPVTLTVVPALPAPRPSGMVSWWRGEGNSSDELGNHPATEVGDFTYGGYDNGKVGQAPNLSSGRYLRVPTFYSPLNRFTIETWFATDALSLGETVPIFEQASQRLTVSLTLTSDYPPLGSLQVTWVDGSGTHQISTDPDVVHFAWSRRSPYDTTFHHLAVTYDNSGDPHPLRLYLNGVLVAAGGQGSNIQLGTSYLYFGFSPSSSLYFTGKLDEMSLYNRPLAQSEILDIYNASIAGKAPLCIAAPANLTAWWEGQNNGADVFGLNPATVQGGVTFTRGLLKQAFRFDGTAQLRVPASPALDVGQSANGFTVEAWVNPDSVSAAQPILEWNSGYISGVAVWVSDQGYLEANVREADLFDNPLLLTAQLTPGVFQHIALTCAVDGNATLYLNGQSVASQSGSALYPPLTSDDFYIGFSPEDDQHITGTQFAGQIDEVAVYSRALSASEITALFRAGGGGKCGIAPTILVPPVGQAANVGNNVVLGVTASGTSLTYQWFFGATLIPGATASILTLNNVQLNQAGNYKVQVANEQNSVMSSSAALAVTSVGNGTSPVIDSQPVGHTVCAGSPLNLSVSAHGSGTLRFQWCKNGININGATTHNFTKSVTSIADSGTYTVVVYDAQGHLSSAAAVVTVYPTPTARVFGDTIISPGMYADLWVVLDGAPPWTITWSDGPTETGVTDALHWRPVSPSTTTHYTVTALSDAHCSAVAGGLSGGADVAVTGPSIQPTLRGGVHELTENTYNNFTFAGDMTYYIAHTITFTGTTKIEGGTVVKFAAASQAKIVISSGTVDCDTASYRPAIFTSLDDDNYGYYHADSTGNPNGIYGQGISLGVAATLKNLRFFNLGNGVSFDAAGTFNLYNCQFIDSDTAIAQGAVTANVNLYNGLFSGDATVFAPNASGTPHLVFQQLTVDGCGVFVSNIPGAGRTWQGANSLLINVAASVPGSLNNVGNTCKILASDTGVFKTGVDGSFYLADNSTYRAAGTTSLDATLLAELSQKTTRAPLFISLLGLSDSIRLSPQVPRCSITAPDIGYCYDALDYVLSGVYVTGGQIEVLPGTAIGMSYDYLLGLDMWEGSSLVARGTVSKPITFVPTTAVQEGPFGAWWPGLLISFIPDYWPNEENSPPPVFDFRFCNFYQSSGICHHFWGGRSPSYLGNLTMSATAVLDARMQDCNLRGGWIDLGEPHYQVIVPVDYGGQVIPGSVLWHNNLFDRVNMNVDVDTGPIYWGSPYPSYSTPTIDLQLLATNNLFRGGFLAMEPVNASAGHWVFENNLFDKVVFAQDANQPLIHDYNGYWPCAGIYDPDTNPGGELLPGQTGTLNPAPLHDVTLIATPAYLTGPLGKFYTGTLLQDLGHGSAASAGLFHYTTRVLQVKDAGTVDIGLHYVATTSSSSALPKDTDNDGIPDYIEDANGNGDAADVTAGLETSPTLAQTTTGTADSLNTIYDDIDLEGDQLTGLAERLISTDPKVSDNPLQSALAALNEVSDIVTIPLNISANADPNLQVLLTVNGTVAKSRVYENAGNWFAEWDTTDLANGVYVIGLEIGAAPDGNTTIAASKAISVQNAICFPNDFPFAGAAIVIRPQTIYKNGTWTVNVYDDAGNLFSSLSGNIDSNGNFVDPVSGSPEVSVNILDGQGNQLPSAYYDVDVTATAAAAAAGGGGGAGETATQRRRIGVELGWNNSKWVVAYQPIFTATAADNDLRTMMAEVLSLIGNSGYGYNAIINSPLTDSGWIPFRLNDTQAKWQQFISDSTPGGVRNFVYFGHYDGYNLGGRGPNAVNLCISKQDLETALHNIPRPWSPGNEHPYRFVFIDGCSSGKGDLCTYFGIPKKKNMTAADFKGLPVRAYVGWKNNKWIGALNAMNQEHKRYFERFWKLWPTINPKIGLPYTLREALRDADYNSSGGKVSNFYKDIVIFGFPDLIFWDGSN